MGAVMTKVRLTNSVDVSNAGDGRISSDQIRTVEVEALVDTGATTLIIPADVVQTLGVKEMYRVEVRLADGSLRSVPIVGDLRLEILGREMVCDAVVMPEGSTPLVGQIPLERLDLVVHPSSRELHANPLHPDGPVLDVLRVA
jgi:clan AA aspartic protease